MNENPMVNVMPCHCSGVAAAIFLAVLGGCTSTETTQPDGSTTSPPAATPTSPPPAPPAAPTPPAPPTGSVAVAFIWTEDEGNKVISLPPGASGGATAINNRGEVVGWFSSVGTGEHAMIWSAENGVRDIHPGGNWGTSSRATAINDFGQVVVVYKDESGVTSSYLWTSGNEPLRITDQSSFDIIGYGINDAGQVVGHRMQTDELVWPFVAFVWSVRDGFVLLSSGASQPRALAADINNAGRAVGFDGWTDGGFVGAPVPTLWTGPQWTRVPLASELRDNACNVAGWDPVYHDHARCGTWARAINDSGEIAGSIGQRAFRMNVGSTIPTTFPALEGTASYANGINNRGDVVGHVVTASGKTPFIWRASGAIRHLGQLEGRSWTIATGVNDRGQVVGFAR